MILSDRDIWKAIMDGGLTIDPIKDMVQPTSVDLHLGPILINEEGQEIDLVRYRSQEGYTMLPGAFLLGATYEIIEIPDDLVGIMVGKSTLARLGLQVEAAGYVDPGWKGNLTVELKNLTQRRGIKLQYGMKIAQIRFEQISSKPEHVYGDADLESHYVGSVGPVEAKTDGLYSPRLRSDPAPE
jgi:dCTP deaminase